MTTRCIFLISHFLFCCTKDLPHMCRHGLSCISIADRLVTGGLMFASDLESPQNWPCHMSISTPRLLSCIVMFYSGPGEYWKNHPLQAGRQQPKQIIQAGHPQSFTDEAPLHPVTEHTETSVWRWQTATDLTSNFQLWKQEGWHIHGVLWVFFSLRWLENPPTSPKEYFVSLFYKREF